MDNFDYDLIPFRDDTRNIQFEITSKMFFIPEDSCTIVYDDSGVIYISDCTLIDFEEVKINYDSNFMIGKKFIFKKNLLPDLRLKELIENNGRYCVRFKYE